MAIGLPGCFRGSAADKSYLLAPISSQFGPSYFLNTRVFLYREACIHQKKGKGVPKRAR